MFENVVEFDKMIKLMDTLLDEKSKRILLGCASKVYGRGGITRICDITGMAPFTIRHGIQDVDNEELIDTSRIRGTGAGRKTILEHYPELLDNIGKIVESNTYGNPENVLFWTTLSLRDIQQILSSDYGIDISHSKIGQLLDQMGYSRQCNQKNLQVGMPNPNRDDQFVFINSKAQEFQNQGEPVNSVDTKKKENIGNFKNNGTEYRKNKDARKVLDHDFPIQELGKVAPMGFMYSTTIRDSSTWEPIMTQQSLQRKVFCVGGIHWGSIPFRMPTGFTSSDCYRLYIRYVPFF